MSARYNVGMFFIISASYLLAYTCITLIAQYATTAYENNIGIAILTLICLSTGLLFLKDKKRIKKGETNEQISP